MYIFKIGLVHTYLLCRDTLQVHFSGQSRGDDDPLMLDFNWTLIKLAKLTDFLYFLGHNTPNMLVY